MYDVRKYLGPLGPQNLKQHDPAGYLGGLDHWSPLSANRMAAEDGLELSDEHWQVIYCLRERFCETGPDWTARQVTRELATYYGESGGLRYLYGLFPRGPLAQGCRLAGLPLPQGTLNRSFGSVH